VPRLLPNRGADSVHAIDVGRTSQTRRRSSDSLDADLRPLIVIRVSGHDGSARTSRSTMGIASHHKTLLIRVAVINVPSSSLDRGIFRFTSLLGTRAQWLLGPRHTDQDPSLIRLNKATIDLTGSLLLCRYFLRP